MIEISDLSKTYASSDGDVAALAGVDTSIDEGEFVCVVGPSGCGKSTLMMIAAGLSVPSSGAVHIQGQKVERPYTELGIVFQRDVLMPWRRTIDNILVQAEFRGMDKDALRPYAAQLLNMVGIDGFEAKYPHELSGGMRQRVAICRALVHDPPLLFMDEPFGALDALTREQLNYDLQSIWLEKRKTVLFITHSIGEAVFLGDRVIVLGERPGTIVADITVDLPRPRGESDRSAEKFGKYTQEIRDIFLNMGVLRTSAVAPSTSGDDPQGRDQSAAR